MSDGPDQPVVGQASVTVVRARPWWSRSGKKLKAAILAAGALASAITAVLTFRLPHDVEDAASFTEITVAAGVPFSQYQQSLDAPHPASKSLGELKALTEPAQPPTGDPTSWGPSGPSYGTETPETVSASATTEPSPSVSNENLPLFGPPNTPSKAAARAIVLKIPRPEVPQSALIQVQREVQATCSDRLYDEFCDTSMRAITAIDVANSNEAAAVISRETTMMKSLRTTRVPGHAKPEPVGVIVTAGVELTGLRGRPVQLAWSLWEKDKGTQLYRQWLNNRLAYEMTATTDHDTAGLDFWIPLPRSHGTYVVRARLSAGTATLTQTTSPSFH